jgi:hypothetical protein
MCYSRSIVRSLRKDLLRDVPFLVHVQENLGTELYIWRGSPTPHLVDARIPHIFAVAGHAKRVVSSDAIKRENHRLPEMLDNRAGEL